jgi:hypothetical protein
MVPGSVLPRAVAAGIYFYKLQTPKAAWRQKVVVAR